jgi:hypothetical protein
MKASWKTTVLGIIAIVMAALTVAKTLIDGDPATNPDWPMVISAVTAGWGLIVARDNSVTSEQAGAK